MRSSPEGDASSQASDMSRRMAEIITGKVIIIVLVMLFAMPFLEVEVSDDFPGYGLDVIELSRNGMCSEPASGELTPQSCDALCAAAQDGCTRAGCREDLGCRYESDAMELLDEYVNLYENEGKGS